MLTNGLTTTSTFWKYLQPIWLRDHQIVTWDLPGHGGSAPAASAMTATIEAQPSIIRAVMAAIGIERACQIGWSTGSQVVLELYRQHPQLCDRLVLLLGGAGHALDATQLPVGGATIDRLARALSPRAFRPVFRLLTIGMPTPLGLAIGRRTGLFGPRVSEADELEIARHIGTVDPTTLLLMLRSIQAHDARSVLPSLRVPLLIVAGDRDPFAPTELVGARLHENAHGSELLRLPEGTHTALLEHYDQIANVVEAFSRR
ncbi:MAG TPA: alpha/beta hydrolase [Polyangiales bacterium]|nr:alpha/beta hydrolase [Polyangiales bacterium]